MAGTLNVGAVHIDREYARIEDSALLLDAFIPQGAGPHPALMLFHGGGWQGGNKNVWRGHGLHFASEGVAVFSIGYRFAPQWTYPAAVDDCITAIRWIRSHAAEFSVDPDRIAAMGGSAGGHLALMLAFLRPGPDDLDAGGRTLRHWLVCAVSDRGPTDLAGEEFASAGGGPIIRTFIGRDHDEAPELYAEASPITHLTADAPPVLFVHGTADTSVPYVQSVKLYERMRAVGAPAEIITVEGSNHQFCGGDPKAVASALGAEEEFLLRHLFS